MHITVIGAGVIGVSWTGLFLAHGHHVTVYDIAKDAPDRVRAGLGQIAPTLDELGLDTAAMERRLRFSADLADVVQETGGASRLQANALGSMRLASLVNSVGLRWATTGPFESFHVGGGSTGFRGFLKHFAKGVQLLWLHSATRPVYLTGAMKAKLLGQIDESFGVRSVEELEAQRDAKQVVVLAALAAQSPHAPER